MTKDIVLRTENTIVEEKHLTLINAIADCQDLRTGDIVTLRFHFLKAIHLMDLTSEVVRNLISFTVSDFGYEYFQIQSFEGLPIILDAERLWKKENEQKSFFF